MSNCIICNNNVSVWSGIKTAGGYLCKECATYIPDVIKKSLEIYEDNNIRMIIENSQSEKNKQFEATASYGNLHIDEKHGLFAVSEKINKDGTIPNPANVFDCLEVQAIDIYCKDPSVNSNGSVSCKVEMMCELINPRISFKCTVKKNAKCNSRKIDATHLNWEEPGDMSMFRNMFNHMIDTAIRRLEREYQDNFLTPETISLFKAETLFMLHEGYDTEEVKSQWKRLIKTFHPDENQDDDGYMKDYSTMINKYYHVLLDHLKQKENKEED